MSGDIILEKGVPGSGPVQALASIAGDHPWIPGVIFIKDPTFQARLKAALEQMVEEDEA